MGFGITRELRDDPLCKSTPSSDESVREKGWKLSDFSIEARNALRGGTRGRDEGSGIG